MRFPKLMLRSTPRAFLVVALFGALHPAPARAETSGAPTRLALLTPPLSPVTSTVALVDAPHAANSDAPPNASRTARTPWWPWLLIAAGAAGVAALVFTSAGKDPACPAGRTCQ